MDENTKEDLHHTGEVIASTQASEGQADVIVVWDCERGLKLKPLLVSHS